MENSNNVTLYHATNFGYFQRIIEDGAIKGQWRQYIELPDCNGLNSLDLVELLKQSTTRRTTYLAYDPILASAYSNNGSDVVFEVKIPYGWVKEHILGPGTYETIDGVEQIPLERVTKIMSNNPNETKRVLIDSGRLDIMVEEWLLTNLGSNLL